MILDFLSLPWRGRLEAVPDDFSVTESEELESWSVRHDDDSEVVRWIPLSILLVTGQKHDSIN